MPKHEPKHGIYYSDYLAIDTLINSQKLESAKHGIDAPDEHLFIIIHQAYELWFKQLLFDLERLMHLAQQNQFDDADVLKAVGLVSRMNTIADLLVHQVDVLNTMTPLDFMDFRNLLVPASGFQSWQFRLFEIRLGVKHHSTGFMAALDPHHKEKIATAMAAPSLFDMLNKWLNRTPFLEMGGFDFWQHYRNAVATMVNEEEQLVLHNPHLTEDEKQLEAAKVRETGEGFNVLFDEKKHQEFQKDGHWRLDYTALKAALFIMLYRDEPLLNAPFKLIDGLVQLDQTLNLWRQRHMHMAQRMIGQKISTGGMSGGSQTYLAKTIQTGLAFKDFAALSTFLLPRKNLPTLPENIQQTLGFNFK